MIANSQRFTHAPSLRAASHLVLASQLLQACLSSMIITRSLLRSWRTAATFLAIPTAFNCSMSSLYVQFFYTVVSVPQVTMISRLCRAGTGFVRVALLAMRLC